MYCKKCGNNLREGVNYCPKCGCPKCGLKVTKSFSISDNYPSNGVNNTNSSFENVFSAIESIKVISKKITNKSQEAIGAKIIEISKTDKYKEIKDRSKTLFEKSKKVKGILAAKIDETHKKALNSSEVIPIATKSTVKKVREIITEKISPSIIIRTTIKILLLPFLVFYFSFFLTIKSCNEAVLDKEIYKSAINNTGIYALAEKKIYSSVPKEVRPLLAGVINKNIIKSKIDVIISDLFSYINGENDDFVGRISLVKEKKNLISNLYFYINKMEAITNEKKIPVILLSSELKKGMGNDVGSIIFVNYIVGEVDRLLDSLKVEKSNKEKEYMNSIFNGVKTKIKPSIDSNIKNEYTIISRNEFTIKYLKINILDRIRNTNKQIKDHLIKPLVVSIILYISIILLSIYKPLINLLFWCSLPIICSGIATFLVYLQLRLEVSLLVFTPIASSLILPMVNKLGINSLYVMLLGFTLFAIFIYNKRSSLKKNTSTNSLDGKF